MRAGVERDKERLRLKKREGKEKSGGGQAV